MKATKIKVRRGWGQLNPMSRVRESVKRYDRNYEKKVWKSNLDFYCN